MFLYSSAWCGISLQDLGHDKTKPCGRWRFGQFVLLTHECSLLTIRPRMPGSYSRFCLFHQKSHMGSGLPKGLFCCKGKSSTSKLNSPPCLALMLAAAFRILPLSAVLQSLIFKIGAISNSLLGVLADGAMRCPRLSGAALHTDPLSLQLSCCLPICFPNKSVFSGDAPLCSQLDGAQSRVKEVVQAVALVS